MNARVVFLGQTDRRDDTRERVKERQREGKGATAPLKGGGNKKGSDGWTKYVISCWRQLVYIPQQSFCSGTFAKSHLHLEPQWDCPCFSVLPRDPHLFLSGPPWGVPKVTACQHWLLSASHIHLSETTSKIKERFKVMGGKRHLGAWQYDAGMKTKWMFIIPSLICFSSKGAPGDIYRTIWFD